MSVNRHQVMGRRTPGFFGAFFTAMGNAYLAATFLTDLIFSEPFNGVAGAILVVVGSIPKSEVMAKQERK